MRILVTGAAGFIGAHITRKLQEDGHFILGVDWFHDETEYKRQRVAALIPSVKILEFDVCDTKKLSEVLSNYYVDTVIHLAAVPGVQRSEREPNLYVHSNIAGFVSVFEAIRTTDLRIKVFYASSSSALELKSLYGVTKKCDEIFATMYRDTYGIESIGIRFQTVYGPWGRPDMAYWHFATKILEDKEITVYQNTARYFSYIDTVVSKFIEFIGSEAHKKYYGSTVDMNVGPRGTPRMLAEHLGTMLRKTPKIVEAELPKNEVYQTYYSYGPLYEHVEKRVDLVTGLAKFVEWYLGQRGTLKLST